MVFALCPWEWSMGDDRPPGWCPPRLATASIDLCVRAQQLRAGGEGAASLFAFERAVDVPKSGVILSDDPQGTLPQAARRALAAFASAADLSARRMTDALFEVLTTRADPDHQAGPRPLLPSRGGLELICGPLIKRVAFDLDDPELGPPVLSVLSADYAKIRALALDSGSRTPSDLHLKYLGAVLRKYPGVDYRRLQGGLPDEQPKAPATAYSEGFAGSGDALGADLSWTEVNGDFDRVSGVGQYVGAGSGNFGSARAEAAVSDDDHTTAMTVISLTGAGANRWIGPAARFDAAAVQAYATFPYTGDGKQYLARVNSASSTTNLVSAAITQALPEPYAIGLSGSTLTGYQSGVSRVSTTDTTYSGDLLGGVAAWQTGPTFDSWSVDDGIAGGSTYEASLSVGLSMHVDESANLAMGEGLALGVGAAVAPGGGLALDAAVALAQTVDAAAAASLALAGTLSIGAAVEIAAAADLTFAGDLPLGLALGLAPGALASFAATATLAQTFGSTATGGQAFGDSVALGIAAGLSGNGGQAFTEAIALAMAAGATGSVTLALGGTIALPQTFAAVASSQAVMQAAAALGIQAAAGILCRAIVEAGIGLSAVQSFTVTASTVSAGLTVPSGRTLTVSVEVRSITVPGDSPIVVGPPRTLLSD